MLESGRGYLAGLLWSEDGQNPGFLGLTGVYQYQLFPVYYALLTMRRVIDALHNDIHRLHNRK